MSVAVNSTAGNCLSSRNELVIDPKSNLNRQAVVVIHGLASHRLLMMPLSWHIQRRGFKVFNFGYRSFFKTIPVHADRLRQRLLKLQRDDRFDQIHLVGHSLGAIICRQLLLGEPGMDQNEQLTKLGRVVMITPPNAGSPAAERLSRLLPYSTTVRQISDVEGSFVRDMGSPNGVEIGVVKASYDFVVSESSADLPTQKDRVTVFGGHNGLLVRPTAARRVIEFLSAGAFEQ